MDVLGAQIQADWEVVVSRDSFLDVTFDKVAVVLWKWLVVVDWNGLVAVDLVALGLKGWFLAVN